MLLNVDSGFAITCGFSREAQIKEPWENWITLQPIQVAILQYNTQCFPMPRQPF